MPDFTTCFERVAAGYAYPDYNRSKLLNYAASNTIETIFALHNNVSMCMWHQIICVADM